MTSAARERSPLVGIFVGGRGRRMGGATKGLLAAPDTGEPLAGRLVRLCERRAPAPDVVFVGDATAYAALARPALADDPPEVGPLGGLAALLAEAQRRGCDAIAVASDLPYVSAEVLHLLMTTAPGSAAVAPWIDGRWQPLFARYAPAPCLPIAKRSLAAGRRRVSTVLEGLAGEAVVLLLEGQQMLELRDWDTPEDVRR